MSIVKSTRPPFLTGTIQFTRQTEMVSIVKDITSDFATLARKGSELLKSFVMEVWIDFEVFMNRKRNRG